MIRVHTYVWDATRQCFTWVWRWMRVSAAGKLRHIASGMAIGVCAGTGIGVVPSKAGHDHEFVPGHTGGQGIVIPADIIYGGFQPTYPPSYYSPSYAPGVVFNPSGERANSPVYFPAADNGTSSIVTPPYTSIDVDHGHGHGHDHDDNSNVTTPEPGTILILGAALITLAIFRRIRV